MDIDQTGLEQTHSLLKGDGHFCGCHDLKDLDGIGGWLVSMVQVFGTINGFVHAAGIAAPWPLKSLSVEAWREVFLINTEAALVLTKSFQKRAIYSGEKGSIVFISSVMVPSGISSAAAVYSSLTKAALLTVWHDLLLWSWLLGNISRQLRCAMLMLRTPMFERTEKLWDAEQKAHVEALHPLGIGRPEDIANATAFLLADTARWITGTVLVVDGGYTAQ